MDPRPPTGRHSSLPLIGGAILLVGLMLAVFLANAAATSWVQGPGFHAMLEKETAKGLHFDRVFYAPVRRVGIFGIRSGWGAGQKGQKTIVAMEGNEVSGAFNPLGIFLRRWQIQYLHFASGTVWLQKTEAKPNEPKPPGPPWYLFFWPDHLHLHLIKVDDANVLFQLQNKESGIHDTFLEITPNGRDFEYDAKGGTFTTPDTPRLNVEHIHLLVRKPRLDCSTMVLGDDTAHPEEQVRVQGHAGLQQDHGITAAADFVSLDVSPWLPEKMRTNVRGHFSGHLDYASTGTGLETAKASGHLALAGGILHDVPVIRTYIAATKSPDPGDLALAVCQTDVKLEQGAISLDNIKVESKGVFELTGHGSMAKDKTLSGELQLGLADAYLKWLPGAEAKIFTQVDGPYHVAVIHLSGSAGKPKQDLSPRILAQIGDHPGVALKLLLNASLSFFESD
jgi:hypothetical protein